jgi:hypothetical protein
MVVLLSLNFSVVRGCWVFIVNAIILRILLFSVSLAALRQDVFIERGRAVVILIE